MRLFPHPLIQLSQKFLALLLAFLLSWWGLPHPLAQARNLSTPVTLAQAIQPYLDRFTDQVTEFTLDNGMKFIVLERHEAPVVSFMVYAKVGAVNEADGKTGVAHYLEHLAFKGTSRIGTRDYEAEKQVLTEMDGVFQQIMEAEQRGDAATVETLQARLEELKQQAASYVEQNKYGQIVEQAGGVGLNATTSAEATRYFYSLPSNKLELWMSLESERFLDPVFREFYEEKDVILEERRMRVDNDPIGLMIEKFLETAFQVHPYRRPVIGYAEDLYGATREDIQTFFNTYYGPENLLAAVVGDVDPAEVQRMAETYFGRYQSSQTQKPEVTTVEPEQTEPREIVLELPTQPWYFEGYHRPSIQHPDHAIYNMIESILTGGRTSRLYKEMVENQQIALDVSSFSGFPGDLYANMLLIYAITAPGHTVEEIQTVLHQELERLQTEPVSQAELDRVKTQARANLLRSLDSNQGIASLLLEYEAKTGSWRNIFRELEAIEAVTQADVQRVAQTVFRADNRTVGKLLTQSDEGPES